MLEVLVGELEMAFRLVHLGTELFVKANGGSVPVKNNEVYTLEAARGREACKLA